MDAIQVTDSTGVGMMQYVFQGFGVCLGVVAGVVITLVVQWLRGRHYRKKRKSNLMFELKLDTNKISVWLDNLGKLRKAIAEDSLIEHYGYLDVSRAVFVTTNDMFLSGELYELLTYDEIGDLQTVISGLSYNSENYFNNQINQDRDAYTKARMEGDNSAVIQVKQNAIRHVQDLQLLFERYKNVLESIASKL